MVNSVMTSWNRSRGSLTISNQAKLALDELTLDLEAAILRLDGRVWMAATVQPNQTSNSGRGDTNLTWVRWRATTGTGATTKPSNSVSLDLDGPDPSVPHETRKLEQFRFGVGGVWLRFFTVERDINTAPSNLSTVRAVSYQVLRYITGDNAPTTTSPIHYGLFRSWVTPDRTFSEGFSLFHEEDGTSAEYNGIGNPPTGGGAGEVASIRRPSKDLLIANHVVDFGVRVWGRDPAGNLVVLFPRTDSLPADQVQGFAARSLPVDFGAPNALPPSPTLGAPTQAQMFFGVPEEIEVALRILTDEGATLLEARERGLAVTTADWWTLVEANSQVHTRRIRVKSAPF
jgi:hypothetical protein